MNTINNGGPAFPESDFVVGRSGKSLGFSHSGMTLRDYFAAKAMQALIQRAPTGSSFGVSHKTTNESYCLASYAIADAMLRAREGGAA